MRLLWSALIAILAACTLPAVAQTIQTRVDRATVIKLQAVDNQLRVHQVALAQAQIDAQAKVGAAQAAVDKDQYERNLLVEEARKALNLPETAVFNPQAFTFQQATPPPAPQPPAPQPQPPPVAPAKK